MVAVNPEDYRNRRTLILGDVNSGKTRLTAAILDAFAEAGEAGRIALLDLAPDPVATVGGKMAPVHSKVRYLTCPIVPPRLTGRDEKDIAALAAANARRIEVLMDAYLSAPRDVLFVNDATLYLQAVLRAGRGYAHAGQPVSHGCQAVALLDPEMGHVPYAGRPAGKGGHHGQGGNHVRHIRHIGIDGRQRSPCEPDTVLFRLPEHDTGCSGKHLSIEAVGVYCSLDTHTRKLIYRSPRRRWIGEEVAFARVEESLIEVIVADEGSKKA